MRVLQINNFEHIGGGSDRVFQLTTKLLLDHGHQVSTLACGSAAFDERKHSYMLARNGYIEPSPIATAKNIRNFISRPDAARMLDRIVATERPDVVHLHIFYGQISSSVLARIRHHKIPCVMTVHEYRMLCPVSTLFTEKLGICEKCAAGNYRHAVLNRCNRDSLAASLLSAVECTVRDRSFDYLAHVDHFFMVSSFCREKHIQYRPRIAEKSSVLYNFVDAPPAQAPSAWEPDRARFLYCGRLSKEKGLHLLCHAFAQRPALKLHVAGDGPIANELKREFSHFPNIVFLGKLGAAELQSEIRQAWFTVAPSEWYENNPMAILESFAQGTPVLAADIGGIPELVLNGQTGLLFRPSDADSLSAALVQANALPLQSRTRLSEQARALVATRHAAELHYQQLLAGYARVIEKAH